MDLIALGKELWKAGWALLRIQDADEKERRARLVDNRAITRLRAILDEVAELIFVQHDYDRARILLREFWRLIDPAPTPGGQGILNEPHLRKWVCSQLRTRADFLDYTLDRIAETQRSYGDEARAAIATSLAAVIQDYGVAPYEVPERLAEALSQGGGGSMSHAHA